MPDLIGLINFVAGALALAWIAFVVALLLTLLWQGYGKP
jgi:hypothetical protein